MDSGYDVDWSPDGAKIIFTGTDSQIYTMNSDGSNIQQVTNDPTAGIFNATGGMAVERYEHTATLLLNEKVFVIGDYSNAVSNTAELYTQ